MSRVALLGLVMCVALGAVASAAAQAPAQAPDTQAAALYRVHCRSCHGLVGVPSQRMSALYNTLLPFDSAFFATRSDDSLIVVIRNGIGQMKPYSEKLAPGEMAGIAGFIRTLATPTAAPRAP